MENNKICDVHVLGEEEALLLKATQDFVDEKDNLVKAGMVWVKEGPLDFIPKPEMQVVEIRKCFTLDKNEGFYVRDKRTGEVRLLKGNEQEKSDKNKGKSRILIAAHEELWEK